MTLRSGALAEAEWTILLSDARAGNTAGKAAGPDRTPMEALKAAGVVHDETSTTGPGGGEEGNPFCVERRMYGAAEANKALVASELAWRSDR